MTASSMIRADVRCDGLFARVNREVQLAAISDVPDRLERLRYWHARQRSAYSVYYGNSLCFSRSSGNEPFRSYESAGRYYGEGEEWLNAEV